jgi:hypothetical protein
MVLNTCSAERGIGVNNYSAGCIPFVTLQGQRKKFKGFIPTYSWRDSKLPAK